MSCKTAWWLNVSFTSVRPEFIIRPNEATLPSGLHSSTCDQKGKQMHQNEWKGWCRTRAQTNETGGMRHLKRSLNSRTSGCLRITRGNHWERGTRTSGKSGPNQAMSF